MTKGGHTSFRSVSRRAVNPLSCDFVRTEPLFEGTEFGLLLRPRSAGHDLIAWCEVHRNYVEALVCRHGALLFRDFDIGTVNEFDLLIKTLYGTAIKYENRASPRRKIAEDVNIYTSTEYPAHQSIFPHNEHSYSPVFPRTVFFHAMVPPGKGGQTPIGCGRALLKAIPRNIVERFTQKGIAYVRNYNDGFGLNWQTAFNTEDKNEVERYCTAHDMEFEWKGGDRLRITTFGPALVRHPVTGEAVWFNHATFFHVTTLPEEIAAGIIDSLKECDYPTNTYYGDGAPIEEETLQCLREAYQSTVKQFDWRQNDVVLLDNMLTMHGRQPYSGARSVIVGMAQPTRQEEVRL